jgi:hypothetical protein
MKYIFLNICLVIVALFVATTSDLTVYCPARKNFEALKIHFSAYVFPYMEGWQGCRLIVLTN